MEKYGTSIASTGIHVRNMEDICVLLSELYYYESSKNQFKINKTQLVHVVSRRKLTITRSANKILCSERYL